MQVLIEIPLLMQPSFKVLLMGDVGWESEFYILQHYPDLKADVIVLGHHGSKYSSAYDFLRQVEPVLAISSSGIDNRYGHPTPQTLARLKALNIQHLDTTMTGQIHLEVKDQRSTWQWSAYRHYKRWLLPSS